MGGDLKNSRIALVIVPLCIGILLVIVINYDLFKTNTTEFLLKPSKRDHSKVEYISDTEVEVGTGWAIGSPEGVVEEVVSKTLENKNQKSPDFAIVHVTSGSDMQKIFTALRKKLGDHTKIYGGTSDSRAIVTNDKFVNAVKKGYSLKNVSEKNNAVALMTISSKKIEFGVGSSDYDESTSVKEAAIKAVTEAMYSAGKSLQELPQLVLLTPTIGGEEQVLLGIEEVVGNETIVMGGTTGGPTFGVFGDSSIYSNGISVAVLYTDLPIGCTFESGFDGTENSGIVTKTDGQVILEIDNKPAMEVYDGWLEGKVKKLYNDSIDHSAIRDMLTLNPWYREYISDDGEHHRLFSHLWPKDSTVDNTAIATSTQIKVGERLYQSYGTWETLLNRIGNLPAQVKYNGEIKADIKPLLGIGVICAGIMGSIPEKERGKISHLINYSIDNAPFIASFPWGEQGYLPGIGNRHGNLSTSFVVIGKKK